MSSASRYRRALMILEKWPTDPSKGDRRDIGVLLRTRIAEQFRKGELSEIAEPEHCDKMLTSLENITADKHKKLYEPTTPLTFGSLGLDYEVVHAAVSEEMMAMLKQEEKDGLIQRTWRSWFGSKDNEKEKNVVT